MKTKVLNFLAVILAALTVIGGLNLADYISILPDNVAKAFAVILPAIAVIVHLINTLGDLIDDGEANGSWRPKLFTFALLLGLCCLLPSCAGIGSAISGQPIHTTPVQRADGTGKAFELATSDLTRAETLPDRQWGLYDAGFVAKKATEVIDSGK